MKYRLRSGKGTLADYLAIAAAVPGHVLGGLVDSALSGFTFPGDVYAGRADPNDIGRALDFAGLATGGMRGSPVRGVIEPRGSAAKYGEDALASRSPGIYNPPAQPPRPFAADYPAGGASDNAGKLTRDIEGRPLVARYVVGRRVVGGDEKTIPVQELESLGKAITGRVPTVGPRSGEGAVLQGRDARLLAAFDRQDGRYLGQHRIVVADDLSRDKAVKVLAHELSHGIDMHVAPPATYDQFSAGKWGIQSADDPAIEAELHRVYRDLNSPDAAHFGPEAFGYPTEMVPRELWAEAIRAYMADPNYLKSVAPKTAARIRAVVNANPRLAPIIQFNEGGVPLGIPAPPDAGGSSHPVRPGEVI